MASAVFNFSPEQNLTRYLQEIRKLPMLSQEIQLALARLWRDHEDVADAHQFVTAYLRLVAKALFLCHTRQGIDENCAAAFANAPSGARMGLNGSGRGKPPRWLVALEQQGHNREECRVKDGQSDLIETAKREHAAAD